MSSKLKQIALSSLQAGQFQPRQDFNQQGIQELADSISNQGLIEPLIVREIAQNYYEIIAGERRWRAAQLAGLKEVPCLVGQYSDQQACALTLIENIQRENLNVIEEANGYQRLIEEFHFHQEEIAAWVGKSRSHIANLLRLLNLSPSIQQALKEKKLTLGHARLLVGLSISEQERMAHQIIEDNWSVRYLEKNIKQLKSTDSKIKDPKKDKDVQRLESVISEQLGAPVHINEQAGEGGWIKLKYYDNDTLAGLLDRLGLEFD